MLIRKPPAYFTMLADQFGDCVHLRFGPSDFYLISDCDMIQDALINQASSFEKFPRVNPRLGLFGDGLLTSEEPHHMRQRRLMQPAFHKARIDAYSRIMTECTNEFLARWQDGQIVDVAAEMNRLTLEIICRTMFGGSSREHAEQVAHSLEVVIPMLNRLVQPLGSVMLSLPLPATRRYFRALEELNRILGHFIAERRAQRSSGDDLLGMLLAAREEESGRAMTDRELRDEAMTIFVAGHETTANALVWTWYLLARHPGIADKLESEVRGQPGDDSLPYTYAVVKESMRVYPPVWILGRRALAEVDLRGLSVHKKNVILVCMYALHRRPHLYPDPGEYRPERWMESGGGQAHRFAYLPFGAGSRLCIGERFAWKEAVLIVAGIARKFRMKLMSKEVVEPLGMLTLRPAGMMQMRLEARA